MTAHVSIPGRFNGPPESGNGGYSCGVLAAYIEGPARIRLHVPPPLDTPLEVRADPGGNMAMYDGETRAARTRRAAGAVAGGGRRGNGPLRLL